MLTVAAFFAAGGHEALDLHNLKARQHQIEAFYRDQPFVVLSAFFLGYVALASTSLPGGAAVTMAGGAVFGALSTTLLVSFASSIGALFAFLLARGLLREWVEERFGTGLRRLDEGIERDGAFYLFLLRLVPAIPFLLVNVGMGLTCMRPWTYYWVSQLGMLAGTFVFANAGAQLATIDSPWEVLSPRVLGALVLLGALPLAAKKLFAKRLPRDV